MVTVTYGLRPILIRADQNRTGKLTIAKFLSMMTMSDLILEY